MQNQGKLYKNCFFILLLFFGIYKQSAAQPAALVDIPELLSNIKINIDNTTDNDFLFFAPSYNDGYAVILNQENEVVFYKKVGGFGARDFKMHTNGLMSYLSGKSEHFIILNENLQVVDSVQCKNGLETDFHDFKILRNGNYCLLCRGRNTKDFSAIGGSPMHEVVDPIIQIQDSTHQVIYEWHSAPHFEGEHIIDILDNFNPNGNLKSFIHLNSIDLDIKDNFLISARFQSQVSYLDRSSGEIVWRLGGKQNEFTFTNDFGFSDQHSARWTSDKTILLFDNRCFVDEKYSRAVEYELDVENKTATKIWEYIRLDSLHSQTMGNTQRLDSGNTLTSWGDGGLEPLRIIEIDPNGEVVFDLSLDSLIYTYSAYKFPWPKLDTMETSVFEPEKISFQLYPNPSANSFTLELENLHLFNKISITNIYGQTIYHSKIAALKSKHNPNLDEGVYLINFHSREHAIHSQKLIIN